MIPRQVLFGNPRKAQPRLSPDGDFLSFLAPSDQGVMNVWLQKLGQPDATMLTQDTHRGILNHQWSEDGRWILYAQDRNGDENWHVYAADRNSGQIRDLTPFEGIRAEGLMTDRRHPSLLKVGLNLRDLQIFDVHCIHLETGKVELDTQNPGDVVGWLADANFQVRASLSSDPADGSAILRVRDSQEAPWRELMRWPFGEHGYPLTFTLDGRSIIVETSLGADTSRLIELDLQTGAELREIARDARADISQVLVNPESLQIEAVSSNYLREEWTWIHESIREDLDFLIKSCRGSLHHVSRDRADRQWILLEDLDNAPSVARLYDRRSRELRTLFVSRPELADYQLSPMQPLIIRARDGLELVSYLTLPPEAQPGRLPLVLNVHGGPWARDEWGLDPEAQWLASRGYAVLQVNFRSSVGFGKSFINAGNGEWGRKMQDDLTDAVRWAIEQGIADPARIAIYGGSYGGYATLAGLTFTPELYACGVDIVGPSNIKTFFESLPSYWLPMKQQVILRVGDAENDPELNRRISPLFHVDKIRVPLLIAQGQNDPRVKIQESNQIVEAMRSHGLRVDYVVYPDEGHGFARPANRMDFYGRAEEFLARHLGGRAEPWAPVEGSSVQTL